MQLNPISSALVLTVCMGAAVAQAQSLTRVQGAGGRQTEGNLVVIGFSPDERYVYVIGDDAVGGDSNGFMDVVRQDRLTGGNSVVSLGVGGIPLNSHVEFASLSADGRRLYMMTPADNLGFADANGTEDVYTRDLVTGTVSRASVGLNGTDPDAGSYFGEVSNDGRFVAFASEATNLVSGDNNGTYDVFLRDTTLNTTQRINVQANGSESPGGADLPQISFDGRYVVYLSYADDLVPGDLNTFGDIFVHDRQLVTTTRVNVGAGGVEADGDSYYWMRASPDTRWIVYGSWATNLAPGATGFLEILRIDRQTGSITIESVGSGGAPSDADSIDPWVSDDGRYTAFFSYATTLDPADLDTGTDMFWHDSLTGVTRIASQSTGGLAGHPPPSSGDSWGWPALSGSGRLVGFETNLQGLVAGDTNSGDSLVWDAFSTVQPIESFCVAKVNSMNCTPAITSGGEPHVAGQSDSFFLSAHNVINNKPGLFIWSMGPAATPMGGGTLCVGSPVKRMSSQLSGGTPTGVNCSGTYSQHFSQAYMAAKGITAGLTIYSQCWSRDNGFLAPNNIGLTDGLRFTVAP